MAGDEDRLQSNPKASVWIVIKEIVGGLKDRPLLLFAFGLSVLLLAAGSLAIERFRLFLLAALVIYVGAVIAWLMTEARQKQTTPSSPEISSPSQTVRGGDVRIEGGKHRGLTIEMGKVTVKGSAIASGQSSVAGGDAQVKGGRTKDVKIKMGEVKKES